MQMIVRTVNGKRMWSFTVDEKRLYELLCTQIAWRVLKKSGKDIKAVEKDTVVLAQSCHKRTDEELKLVTDAFIRAVFQERKRLNLKEYQLQEGGEESESKG